MGRRNTMLLLGWFFLTTSSCFYTANDDPPINAEAGFDQTVAVGEIVNLDGTASAGGGRLAFQWFLNAKPAGSAAEIAAAASAVAEFEIDRPGQYDIDLIVSIGDGFATDSVSISTVNSAPVAHAGDPVPATVGTSVQLDGARSHDADGDRLGFHWSLLSVPAGSRATLDDPNAIRPTLSVDVPGDYIALLSVDDGKTLSDFALTTVTTGNVAPVVDAGPDRRVMVGETVSLHGSATDANGDVITKEWRLLDAPAASRAALEGNRATPVLTIDQPGRYVVQLSASDGVSRDRSDSVVLSTLNSRPVAHAGFESIAAAGGRIVLDGRYSVDADDDPLDFRWALIAVPSGSHTGLDDLHTATPAFVADLPGLYLAQLVVGDGQLKSAPATVLIHALPSGPPIAMPLEDSASGGRPVFEPAQPAGPGSQIDLARLGQDTDGDGVPDGSDNCVNQANPAQRDTDGDGFGNFCDPDLNNDGIVNFADLQILREGFLQPGVNSDLNGDGFVNFGDLSIMNAFFFAPPGPTGLDSDGDGVFVEEDNCYLVNNPGQRDTDGDGFGNFCDADFTGDGLVNFADLDILQERFFTSDPDTDLNGDGIVNFIDLDIFGQLIFGPPGPSGLYPPVITPVNNINAAPGNTVVIALEVSNPNQTLLTYSVDPLPANATFDTATGVFNFTPSAGQLGQTFNLTFGVTDGVLSDTEAVTIQVSGVPVSCMPPTPARGPVGSVVTLFGSGFIGGSNTVFFNGVGAAIVFENASRIDTLVPGGASDGPISVDVGGQVVTCGPFAINDSPTLDPIGNKIAPLGQLTTFTVSASDPDDASLQITVSPQPLPVGATFNGSLFRFTPKLNQVGVYTLTFRASDGNLIDTETITLTVPPPSPTTTYSGLVQTTGPGGIEGLAGVRLVLGNVGLPQIETFSQADGSFFFNNVTVSGSQRLLVDGSTVPGPPSGTYATVPEQMTVVAGASNVLANPIFLLPLDLASADPIDPQQDSVIDSSPVVIMGQTFDPIMLMVDAGTAMVEDTGDPFAGDVSITRIEDAELGPQPLPDDIDLSIYIAVQPFGVSYDPPAVIVFPNVEGFPVGVVVDIFGLNHDTGVFEKVGDGRVEADGMVHSGRLNEDGSFTPGGVVRENSWHGFVPRPPEGEDDDASDDPGDDPDPCDGGSTVCPQSGDLVVAHETPRYQSLSTDRNIRLEYHSQQAAPHPFVSRLWTPGNLAPPPLAMTAKLRIGGIEEDAEVFFEPPPCSPFSCPFARFPATTDASAYSTGVYTAEYTLSCLFPISRRDALYTQKVAIINEIDSPFGAGWTVLGLERIIESETGDLLLIGGGRSDSATFTPALRATAGIVQPGEQDFYHFAANTGATVSLLMRRISDQPDGSSGLDPRLEVRTSTGITVVSDNDSALSVVSGPGEDAEITGFVLPATDTYVVVASGAGGSTGAYDLFLSSANDTPLAQGQINPLENVQPSFVFAGEISQIGQVSTHTFAASAGTRISVEVNRVANQPDGSGTLDPFVEILSSNNFVIFSDADSGSDSPPGPGQNALIISEELPATDLYTIRIAGTGGTTGPYEARVTFADLTGPLTGDTGNVLVAPAVINPIGDFSELVVNPDDTYTRAEPNGFVKSYDTEGRLTSVSEPNGNTVDYMYDGQGRLTSIVDPLGLQTLFRYNDAGSSGTCLGRLQEIEDPAGRITGFLHDNDCNLVSITGPGGAQRAFTYDDRHLLLSQTSARGSETSSDTTDFVTSYTYDDSGRYLSATLPDSSQRSMTPNHTIGLAVPPESCELPTPDLGCEENPTTPTVASNINVTFTDAENRTTQLGVLDSAGRASTVIDPLGRVTSVDHDISGNITQLQLPSGHTVQTAYNDVGNPTTLVDLTLSGTTLMRYGPLQRLTAITNAAGGETVLGYDGNGNIVQLTSPEGRSISISYRPDGLPATTTSTSGTVTSFIYTPEGQPSEMRVGSGPDQRVFKTTYNARGLAATLTDPVSRQYSYFYDENNRQTRGIANGVTTEYSYDANGNLASITPPGRPAHVFVYGERDFRSDYVPPSVSPADPRITFLVNNEGQITSITRPDGSAVVTSYDGAGDADTVTIGRGIFDYTRNASTGRLTQSTSPDGVILDYAYQGQELTGVTQTGPLAGSVSWALDGDAQVVSRSVNGGDTILYDYDLDGELVAAGELTIQLDPNTGRLSSSKIQTVSTTRAFNGFAEVTSESAFTSADVFYDASYLRDKIGRITQATETVEGVTTVYNYAYSVAGRLREVKQGGVVVDTFTYGNNGNRLSRNSSGVVTTGVYDAQDRLLSYGGTNFSYTENGDLASRTVGGATTTYQYDEVGNLYEVGLPDGRTVEYLADAEGRRVAKRVDSVLAGGFLYRDALNPIAELDAAGNVVARFVYADRATTPAYMVRGADTYRFVTDIRGSPRLIVNAATGDIAQRIDYDAFGRVLSDTNPGFQPFGFAGGLYDADTGLLRFGSRDYDPHIGRWTTKDPISFDGGTNLYGYALNDPINLVDVNGQAFFVVTGLIGGVAGFVGNSVGQLIRNGGFDCFSLTEAAIAGGVGLVAGAAAPFVATTYLGAAGLGATANLVQYGATNYANGQPSTLGGAAFAAGTGVVGGVIGGPVTRGGGLRYSESSPFFPPGWARQMNNAADIRGALGRHNLARALGGGAVANVPDSAGGSGEDCGCD